jgi:hypothetical protein
LAGTATLLLLLSIEYCDTIAGALYQQAKVDLFSQPYKTHRCCWAVLQEDSDV